MRVSIFWTAHRSISRTYLVIKLTKRAATPLDKQISIYSVTYGTDLMQRRNRVHVRVQSHANASAITRECE